MQPSQHQGKAMTALRERAEAIYYSLHMRVSSSPEDIAKIEATLRALVQEMEQVAIRRRIAEVGGDWDRGYNMAVADIAQAIKGAGE